MCLPTDGAGQSGEDHRRRPNVLFYRDDFSDSENLLATLAAGDRVKIGAHRLQDGSYWLHWLLHGTKGRLEPDRTLKYKLKYFALLVLGAALAGGFPAAFFIMDGEDSG